MELWTVLVPLGKVVAYLLSLLMVGTGLFILHFQSMLSPSTFTYCRQLIFHSSVDLDLKAQGDVEIDNHHTVEDCGICLGRAFSQAIGDKKGINRYGFFLLPMDDALIRVALDFSGRSFLNWKVKFPTNSVGAFDLELLREFFYAFSMNSGATIHIEMLDGVNSHHIAEAIFKAVGKAVKMALAKDQTSEKIPSTKGSL